MNRVCNHIIRLTSLAKETFLNISEPKLTPWASFFLKKILDVLFEKFPVFMSPKVNYGLNTSSSFLYPAAINLVQPRPLFP
jgi:hypothetical protein